jgi:hypothetical protein
MTGVMRLNGQNSDKSMKSPGSLRWIWSKEIGQRALQHRSVQCHLYTEGDAYRKQD